MVLASSSLVTDFLFPLAVAVVVIGLPILIRFLVNLTKDVREIKSVLVTATPTRLVPHPAPGLVDTVAALVRQSNANLEGTAALIRDSKPDDGSTSRDVLDRLDAAAQADHHGDHHDTRDGGATGGSR